MLRLGAVLDGTTPPTFPPIDHHSPGYYAECGRPPLEVVARESRATSAALLAAVRAVSDADLLDPLRHPWLGGRQLALQLVVRGFWHPLGHLGDHFIDNGRAEAAYVLHQAAITEASRPGVTAMMRGMAYYSLGCAQARSGENAEAIKTLTTATSLNPDLAANLTADRDLDELRREGLLDRLPLGRPT